MVHLLVDFWDYVIVFLFILTVVVFVHEMGHFLLARLNGVRVEVFSVGFGPELVGFTARSGTRWKICALPIGGYVKMFGDANAASMPDGGLDTLSAEERALSFPAKKLWQRASIVAAGPLFNLAFGVVVLAVLFVIYGETRLSPVVGAVTPDSAAAECGIQAHDRIISADNEPIERFQDLQRVVGLSVDGSVSLVLERAGQRLTVIAHPRMTEVKDVLGDVHKRPLLGIQSDPAAVEVVRHGPVSALAAAGRETGSMITTTLTAVGQMLVGSRGTEDLSGPLRIAKGAGQAAQLGVSSVVFYIILLSINLGLINLFPVPLLDGGHLLFYGVEAVLGRPLGAKAQEYGFRLGLFLVFALMLLATRNDLVDLKVWELIKSIVS